MRLFCTSARNFLPPDGFPITDKNLAQIMELGKVAAIVVICIILLGAILSVIGSLVLTFYSPLSGIVSLLFAGLTAYAMASAVGCLTK